MNKEQEKKQLPKNQQEKSKELIDKLAQQLWQQVGEVRLALKVLQQQRLSSINPNVVEKEWYHKQIESFKGFKGDVYDLLNSSQKAILKGLKKDTKALQLTSDKVVNGQRRIIQDVFKQMGNETIKQQQQSIATIHLQSESAKPLEKLIADRITHQSPLFVEMDDGRKWKTENYLEMRVRTDLNNEVSNRMIEAGQQYGVVFYIASSFG